MKKEAVRYILFSISSVISLGLIRMTCRNFFFVAADPAPIEDISTVGNPKSNEIELKWSALKGNAAFIVIQVYSNGGLQVNMYNYNML